MPLGDLAGGLGSSCLCSAQLLGQGNGRQRGLTSQTEDPWGQQDLGQEMGSPLALDQPPIFLGPQLPHLIKEGLLRLTVSQEFFLFVIR